MPELPEVETVVRCLRPLLEGRQIKTGKVLCPSMLWKNPAVFLRKIRRQVITDLQRKGKYILCHLSSGDLLVIHLGMSGRLYCAEHQTPLAKHTHLILFLADSTQELRFEDPRRFGKVLLLGARDKSTCPQLESLGPDPLQISSQEFCQALASRKREIKALLLDQHFLCGIGNIYSDEALFLSRLHPRQPAHRIPRPQAKRLHQAIRQVLTRAIRAGGSSIRDYVDGLRRPGQFQLQYNVYGRTGEPCRKEDCCAAILRITAGGRSAHFCPRCQVLSR